MTRNFLEEAKAQSDVNRAAILKREQAANEAAQKSIDDFKAKKSASYKLIDDAFDNAAKDLTEGGYMASVTGESFYARDGVTIEKYVPVLHFVLSSSWEDHSSHFVTLKAIPILEGWILQAFIEKSLGAMRNTERPFGDEVRILFGPPAVQQLGDHIRDFITSTFDEPTSL